MCFLRVTAAWQEQSKVESDNSIDTVDEKDGLGLQRNRLPVLQADDSKLYLCFATDSQVNLVPKNMFELQHSQTEMIWLSNSNEHLKLHHTKDSHPINHQPAHLVCFHATTKHTLRGMTGWTFWTSWWFLVVCWRCLKTLQQKKRQKYVQRNQFFLFFSIFFYDDRLVTISLLVHDIFFPGLHASPQEAFGDSFPVDAPFLRLLRFAKVARSLRVLKRCLLSTISIFLLFLSNTAMN